VTWVAPNNQGSPITYYTVFLDGDGNDSDDYVQIATTVNTFYNMASGVVQGVVYKFKIIATNSRGDSQLSPECLVQAASVPAQPLAPTLMSQDQTQITVKWLAPDDRGQPVTHYELNWDEGTGDSPRSVLATVGSNVFSQSTSVLVPDLTDGANYKFAVRAQNAEGFGPYSASTTLMAATQPSKPLTPTILSASSASISIQWTQPASGGSPITNYNVYVAVGPTVTDSSYSLHADTGLTQQYLMTTVTPAETYWFKVLAINLVGQGPLSDGVSRIAASVPSPPVDLQMVF
jgi:predicted phage tail protein